MAQSDSFGHLWLSTNHGVFRYVPGEGADGWYAGTWTNFGSDPADSASLADNFCTDILAEDYPVYLHTQPGSYRAIKLYTDFGFALLTDQQVGFRENELEIGLPYLKEKMPEADFARLRFESAPEDFLQAVKSSPVSQF